MCGMCIGDKVSLLETELMFREIFCKGIPESAVRKPVQSTRAVKKINFGFFSNKAMLYVNIYA